MRFISHFHVYLDIFQSKVNTLKVETNIFQTKLSPLKMAEVIFRMNEQL